jgi:NADH-quinone oxidoreductase subunit N
MDIVSIPNLESLRYFLPELVLVGAILVLVVTDLIARNGGRVVVFAVSMVSLGLAIALSLRYYGEAPATLFGTMIAIDPLAIYAKLLFYVSTALVLAVSYTSPDTAKLRMGEYGALMLSAAVGMSLMAAATNLLMMYMAVEMVSIASYILSGYLKGNRRSIEAALKYVVYGAASSGAMLYGMSILFGIAGTANIFEIGQYLGPDSPYRLATLVAVGFLLAGLGFKISSVPFHFWTPDVYEGAPTPIAAYLSVASKAAGFALMVRLFYSGLARITDAGGWLPLGNIEWPTLVAVISAATMTLGNLAAIPQNNLKRLLAYSTIAHAGYMLMGFVVLSELGVQAILFYLGVYLIMNLGAFFVVIMVAKTAGGEDISFYRGLGWRSSVLGVSMAVFLVSLTGIPPSAGFIGKLYIFAAVIQEKYYWLAVVGILNSVVSLYYYARVLKAMFLSPVEDAPPISVPLGSRILLIVLVVPILLFGVYWSPLWDLVAKSAAFINP